MARDAAQRPSGILGTTRRGMNLLQVAASRDDAETVRLALARGLSPVVPASDLTAKKLSPLCCAVLHGSLAVMRVLLAVPQVRGGATDFPLVVRLAVLSWNMEALEVLLEALGGEAFGPETYSVRYELYAVAVEFTAMQRKDCVEVLEKLVVIGHGLKRKYEVIARPGFCSTCPLRSAEQFAAMGIHLAEIDPAPENVAFMKEWLGKYTR